MSPLRIAGIAACVAALIVMAILGRADKEKQTSARIATEQHELNELALRGRVRIGMSAAQCRLAWGEPDGINSASTSGDRREQWRYANGKYLYLDNDVVTAIQD